MSKPLISIIVIAYDMQRQALNTLFSLSCAYQEGVSAEDYEVIVVENRSQRNMDADAIAALPGNFSYYLRDEPGVSPAAAINFGFSKAKGSSIGVMIDGARMVTPGVIQNALMAFKITADALVIVPGYSLGEHEQQLQSIHGYTEAKEMALLNGIDWQHNGYRLFDICCLSRANFNGVFHPFMECNCLFMSANMFRDIGMADERFNLSGGGSLNLYIYRKAALHPYARSFMLAGEGSFHQLHGGVTTSDVEGREALLLTHKEQLCALLGASFRSPTIEPTLLGKIRGPALSALRYSVERGIVRTERYVAENLPLYGDERRKKLLREGLE